MYLYLYLNLSSQFFPLEEEASYVLHRSGKYYLTSISNFICTVMGDHFENSTLFHYG